MATSWSLGGLGQVLLGALCEEDEMMRWRLLEGACFDALARLIHSARAGRRNQEIQARARQRQRGAVVLRSGLDSLEMQGDPALRYRGVTDRCRWLRVGDSGIKSY